jgi:protein-tyrosine kinase
VMEKSDVVSIATGAAVTHPERWIGAILIQAGRLTTEENERILKLQHEQNLRFGDAAIQLGLLAPGDIEFALSQQFNYPYLLRGDSKVSESLVAAYTTSGPHLEALRALRTELLLRWFEVDTSHKTLAIVGGERREGRSFIAANLAVAFSLLGKRTLLIDADMRNPSQHTLFGADNRAGLSAVLSGRGGSETIIHIPGLLDLSLLPAGIMPPNPAELLSRPLFSKMLTELKQEFDIILIDTPAASGCADAQTIAVRAGAALIVVRKNFTRMWRVRGISNTMVQTSATVVGTVLNDY